MSIKPDPPDAPRDRVASRRAVLKLLGLGASALCLPALDGCERSGKDEPEAKAPRTGAEHADGGIDAISPIERTLPESAPRRFSGDDPARAHKILWDKQAYIDSKRGLPIPSEKVALVIIGGGMSGLTSAWRLRKHRPVILERAARFGGNSRGESWQGIDYSIGAAFFVKPEAGSPIDGLIKELGLAEVCRERTVDDPVVLHGRRYRAFWEGETDPASKRQFVKLGRHFHDVLEEKNGWFYPDIPVTDPGMRKKVNELDRITFLQYLEKIAGRRLHPHIETAIEHFCWSSFAASAREISAACGLNFYAAEFDTLMVAPGGNSAIAEALLKRLAAELPRSNLRPGSLVLDVRVGGEGVQVSYEDPQGNLRSLLAQAVILACPKFAVAKMLHEVEVERLAAIRRLRYNAYLVANVLLKGAVQDDFYDLFLLGEGKVDADIRKAAEKQKVTDVVLGTYARPQPDRTVLSLYRALPYAGGRTTILADETLPKIRTEFEEQIQREILPLVGRSAADVVDIRVTRWGHPLPVAEAGLIANGVVDALRKPFRDRVFFVEQDNWALPAFETSVTEALHFAPQVDRALSSKPAVN